MTAASRELRYTCAVPFSPILSGLAEMILAERKARGLSVRAAAEECGIPYNCLSRAERNIGLPSTPVFMAILAWLGVPGWDTCAEALSAAAVEADESADDRWDGPTDRAVCPRCGKSVHVRVDGTLNAHRRLRSVDRCGGSHEAPAVKATVGVS